MEQKLKTDFDKFISTSNFSNQEIKLKKEALNNFLKNGFPSRKLENWKFSDIKQIIQKNIGELGFYNDYNIENEINEDIFINEIEHNKIVIVNGKVERLNFEYEESDKINLTTVDNLKQNSNLDEDLLLSLPDEIIEEIMSYLSYSDLYNLSEIGKRLENCTVRARKKMPFSKFHSLTSVQVSIVSYQGITFILLK